MIVVPRLALHQPELRNDRQWSRMIKLRKSGHVGSLSKC